MATGELPDQHQTNSADANLVSLEKRVERLPRRESKQAT
jgi:hypothetical protein